MSNTRLIAAGRTAHHDLYPRVSLAPTVPYWERPDLWQSFWWAGDPHLMPRQRIDPKEGGGHTTVLDHLALSQRRGRTTPTLVLTNPRIHRLLAVLYGLHQANSKQLAAWAGIPHRDVHKYLGALYEYGLVARGTYATDGLVTGGETYIYQLHAGAPLRNWVKRRRQLDRDLGETCLTDIFGEANPKVRAPRRQKRHNMLVAEAVLRIVETNPNIDLVVGEPDARPDRLIPLGDAPNLQADAALRRSDGLWIFLEVVSSYDRRHLRSQMHRWARWFASTPYHESGMVLVFLNANTNDHLRTGRTLRQVFTGLRPENSQVGTGLPLLRRTDGAMADTLDFIRVERQMMLASWQDWFRGCDVTDAGAKLMAAGSPGTGLWSPVPLGDPEAWPNPAGHRAPAANLPALFSPPWLRPAHQST